MSDQAQLRTFLARALPWPTEEEQHYVNVHWLTWNEQKQRTFWSGRACRSIEDAMRAITWANGLPDTRDIYVCMSAQKTADPKISKNGNKYLAPIRNQQNVVSLKDLFLDIDVKGGDKGYDDAKAAVAALAAFIKAIDLPRPTMVVGSGGGLHAHWELDEALPPADWQRLANALAEATRQQGLKCDTQVTVDSARVLRPPQTKNWKSDPPKPTRIVGNVVEGSYSVARIERALAPFVQASRPSVPSVSVNGADVSGLVGAKPSANLPVAENDLAAGIDTRPIISLDAIAPECPFVMEAITTGGKDFGQPLWNLTTLLATFTEGEREDAHRMAAGHADYSKESTDALYDRKAREKKEKDLGWPSCQSVLNAGCAACAKCPHLKEGKSPLNWMPKTHLVNPKEQPDLPRGYLRDDKNIICIQKYDDQGNTTLLPIIDYPISDAWLQKDPWVLHFSAVLTGQKKSKLEIPYTSIVEKAPLMKELAQRGIVVEPWLGKTVMEFFVSWTKILQARKNAVAETQPFGWTVEAGKVVGFSFAGNVWTPEGDRPSAQADRELQMKYTPKGEADAWHEALKLIGKNRPALEAIIATSFGAPLVRFTGFDGTFLNAYSSASGIGKTTAMRLAQAVWAAPVSGMNGLTDTVNQVIKKVADLRSLPIYWDELKTEEDTKRFVNLVFQITSGKDKGRLNRDGSLRDTGEWQTLLVCATNESLMEHVAAYTASTTAGVYRVFEIEVPAASKPSGVSTSVAQRIMGKLRDNHGVIGLEYAKYIGENWEAIDKEVAEYSVSLGERVQFRQDERFWQATIVCTVLGARLSNRLGFTQFNEKGIEDFMLKSLGIMRLQSREMHVDLTDVTNILNLFTQFLKHMNRHTLWTNKIHIARGKPRPGDYKIVRDASKLDGVHVHIGVDDQLIRFSSTALSDWLGQRKISRHTFTKEFQRQFGAKKTNGRLGSGTDRAGGTEYLWEIDAAGTALAAFIQDGIDEEGNSG